MKWITYDLKWKILLQKEKLPVLIYICGKSFIKKLIYYYNYNNIMFISFTDWVKGVWDSDFTEVDLTDDVSMDQNDRELTQILQTLRAELAQWNAGNKDKGEFKPFRYTYTF